MPELFNPVDYAVPVFILLIVIEMLWARRKAPEKYEPKDTLTSLAFGTGSTVAGALTGGLVFAMMLWLYEHRLFDIGWAWWAWIACFVLDDLAYYVFHRSAHRVRWLMGEPCEPPFEPALQSVDRVAADMDRLHRSQFHLPHAARAGRLPSGDDRLLRRHQPDLPVLDPHRGGRPDAALVRGGDEHAVAPPRPPRHQPALSRRKLCGGLHHLGQDVRQLHARNRRRENPLRYRQAAGHVQPAVQRVSRMDRDRQGRLVRTLATQNGLYVAPAGLEPRWQPRHHQTASRRAGVPSSKIGQPLPNSDCQI
jgi:hypothetical protein